MNPREVLIAARDKIADPGCWTRHAYARDSNGFTVSSEEDPRARCWCSLEALKAVSGGVAGEMQFAYARALLSLREASISLGYPGIARLNDESNHATVMKMFNKAIKAEE